MRQVPIIRSSPTLPNEKTKHLLVRSGKISKRISFPFDPNKLQKYVNLDSKAAASFYLPSGSYGIYEHNEGGFRLGPIVGIITSRNNEKPFPTGKNARLFKEIFDACKLHGMFLFEFYPEGVNFKRNTIKGYSLSNIGKFFNGIFPIPDVVYNRIRYRVIEQRVDVRHILLRLRNDPEIYFFNTRFLNKLEVYKVLSEDPLTCHFIPEAALLNSRSLNYLLDKYKSVYIKPIANSRGKGILKLSLGHHNEYSLHHANSMYCYKKKNVSNIYVNLRLSGLNPKNYLVQKAISLAKYRGRVFDLRVQAQKNGLGKWILTGAGVRVAGPNRIVTHIPNGGSAKEYETVMNEVFSHNPGAKENIDKQLNEIAKIVPMILEKKLQIELAIVSMDIGVDQRGKLWLIEVNSKPASFDEDFIRAIHTRNLAEYFLFAALNNSWKGMVKHWN